MRKKPSFWLLIQVAGLSLYFSIAAAAQLPTQQFSATPFPTGLRPMGVTVTTAPVSGSLGSARAGYAVVANSGDNSVSILGLDGQALSVVTGIPSPYSLATCAIDNNGRVPVLVTSPSDNSVRVLTVSFRGGGGVGAPVQTGLQPYSIACTGGLGGPSGTGVVSNVGDNTLTVFDVATLNIRAKIPGVPGSRAVHGIAVSTFPGISVNPLAGNSDYHYAWVAGTDANVVTIVDLDNSKVLTQIGVSRPTAVRTGPSGIYVASAGTGSITAYNPGTASQVNNLFKLIPNPQDFVFSSLLGDFAISEGTSPDQNSLWKFDFTLNPSSGGSVANIPGAAALTDVFYIGDTGIPPCCPVLLVTSTSTNSVYLIKQAPPALPPIPPADFSISNGASFDQTRVASGSLASAFATAGVSQSLKVISFPLPLSLGGARLSIGGTLSFDTPSNNWIYSSRGSVQAPLLFVGPNQINFQIPPGIALGSAVPAQLTKPDGTTLLTTLNITATAPGIFSLSQDGRFQGAVLNDDFSQNGAPQVIAGAKPAALGSVIQIYATGGGETTPSLLPGEAAPASGNPLILTTAQPTVTIGGQPATVQFSGMAPGFVGLWQINAQIPQTVTPGNAVQLVVSAGGATSNTVTIAVQ